jgi:anti-repressor protein|nr:MAG TPA: repressor domain protein [Caudoviricetes sp.]
MLKKIIVMTENQNLTVIDSEVICNQQVNVYGTMEKPLFLAKDVANWLGHSNPSMMLSKIDKEDKIIIYAKLSLQNSDITNAYISSESDSCKSNNYLFLTEFGVYEVLMQSRLPKAKEFKKGVKEILKRIRLTGKYEADTHSDDDRSRDLIEALKENNALLRQALQASTNTRQHEANNQYCDDAPKNGPFFNITTIAKKLKTTAQYLNNMLSNNGYIVNINGSWYPTEKLTNLPMVVYCKRTYHVFGDDIKAYVAWNHLGFNLINQLFQMENSDKSLFDEESRPF